MATKGKTKMKKTAKMAKSKSSNVKTKTSKMKGMDLSDDEEEKELRIQRPMGQRITSRLGGADDVRKTPVGAIMRKGVIVLDGSKSVLDASRVMKKNFIGSIIITEKGKAVGIITERDIVRSIVADRKDPAASKLSKVMSTPIRVVTEDRPVEEAIALMRKFRIKKLPVLDMQRRLVGIVTETDIARAAPGLLDLAMELTNILRFEADTLGEGKRSEEEDEEYGRYGEGTEGHRETE